MTPTITAEEAAEQLAKLRTLRMKLEAEMNALAGVIDRAEATTRASRLRRSRREIPPCGTESGYQRHRYYKEVRCDECKAAHAEHTAIRFAEKQARLRAIKNAA